jgi:hypothetical protein
MAYYHLGIAVARYLTGGVGPLIAERAPDVKRR